MQPQGGMAAPGVEFIDEINEQEKTDFLGQASALMFLIDWPEPFGLSMIEAMACGTPVLALRRGSVEEVAEDGLTGHIVGQRGPGGVTLPQVMGPGSPCGASAKSGSPLRGSRRTMCWCISPCLRRH
jgi:glycosyl transferase family 1